MTTTKIHTTELASEHLEVEGGKYKLDSASINGHSLPPIVYNPDEQTIHSEGGKKLDVKVTTFEDDPVDLDPMVEIVDEFGRDTRWDYFGPHGSAKADEKARLQKQRAQSLIEHAVRS